MSANNKMLLLSFIKLKLLDLVATIFTLLTKYPPFSYFGIQYLFHYDNNKYWIFWKKMVKGWYQIWIKGWEVDNYFLYFYCGLDFPKRKNRLAEIQNHIDKRVGRNIVSIVSYENMILSLRISKSHFKEDDLVS